MIVCYYDVERECKKNCTRTEECVACIIEEAEQLRRYKVIGDADSYSDYNQGWCDAIDRIRSYVESL